MKLIVYRFLNVNGVVCTAEYINGDPDYALYSDQDERFVIDIPEEQIQGLIQDRMNARDKYLSALPEPLRTFILDISDFDPREKVIESIISEQLLPVQEADLHITPGL